MRSNTIIVATMLIAAAHLDAQVVADNATNTLSNVTNNINGDVIVGTNGSFTLLMLADNSLLTNSGNGVIGLNSTAKSNEVRLISPTSRWHVGGTLLVGSNGVASRLVVSNGAVVESLYGNIGPKSAGSNHSVLITGAGSLWTNQSTFAVSGGIFISSRSNQLVVSNGGALDCGGGTTVAGFGSQVLIAGPGSRWANGSDFSFGGTSNLLEVSDGASLVTSNATLTDFTTSGGRHYFPHGPRHDMDQ
jgi:T5SS/PEP-CTERM-associated repeat protein